MLSRLPLISGRIYFDKEIESDVRDTDYNVVWSLGNSVESGETVDVMLLVSTLIYSENLGDFFLL